MAEQQTERRPSKKSSTNERSIISKKKTKAELAQETYVARQYAILIRELKAAECEGVS